VVPRPERDRDEAEIALECHVGHRRERAVAARHPERPLRRRARDLSHVFAFLENVRLHAAALRLALQLVRVRPLVPGARVDDEEAGHARS